MLITRINQRAESRIADPVLQQTYSMISEVTDLCNHMARDCLLYPQRPLFGVWVVQIRIGIGLRAFPGISAAGHLWIDERPQGRSRTVRWNATVAGLECRKIHHG